MADTRGGFREPGCTATSIIADMRGQAYSDVGLSLRRCAVPIGVPRRTADAYERLCALAGYRAAAGGRAGLAR